MAGKDWQPHSGTAAFRKLRDKLLADRSCGVTADKLRAEVAKTKKVGPALAFAHLKDVHNDKDAFQVVKSAWTNLEKHCGYLFTHWSTGETVTATQALLGDMQLLWMRRNDNPNDVIEWIKETAV